MKRYIAVLAALFMFFPLVTVKAAVADNQCVNFYTYEKDQCNENYPDREDDWHWSLCMNQAAEDYQNCQGADNRPYCYTVYADGTGGWTGPSQPHDSFGTTYCNVGFKGFPKTPKAGLMLASTRFSPTIFYKLRGPSVVLAR